MSYTTVQFCIHNKPFTKHVNQEALDTLVIPVTLLVKKKHLAWYQVDEKSSIITSMACLPYSRNTSGYQLARADQGSVKAPCQYRLAMGSINEGSGFSMHSATKFKCNYVVIDVVHSGIKMTGSYFSEFRWDEKCCNSLHEYKDYSKTHPLPQYAQMINFIPITQCSPKWYCDACRTARAWRQRMAQRCPVNRQHRVFFYMGSLGF